MTLVAAADTSHARAVAVDAARSKIGTIERPVNLVEFNRWYYGRDQSAAWCATFWSWCVFMANAACPASTAKGFAYVPSGTTWAKNNGLWKPHVPGRRVGDPGDGAVFSFGGKRPDHIEMVETWDAAAKSYINIGGNTGRPGGGGSQVDGGGVWRRVRASSLLGFIVPPYPLNTTPPAPVPAPIPPEAVGMRYYIISKKGSAAQFYFWPDLGPKGTKNIIPSGPDSDDADNQDTHEGFGGRLVFDGPDLDAIPLLRDA